MIEETESDKSFSLDLKTSQDSTKRFVVYMVMGPQDEKFVNMNLDLIQRLNSDVPISFVLSIQDENWRDFESFPQIHLGNRILIQQGDFSIREEERDLYQRSRASLYHARALQNLFGIPISNTNTIVVLDPDFYIIKENWMRLFCGNLDDKTLFFGAGYNPKHISGYKDFPTPYFLMFNTKSVHPEELNTYPNPKKVEVWPGSETTKSALLIWAGRIRRLILPLVSTVTWRTLKSNDTGFQIAEKFTSKRAKCLAVAIRKSDFFMPLHLRTRVGRYIESTLFAKFSFGLMPSRENFCEKDLSNVSNSAWDEYYDSGEFVAFHVRKSFSVSVYNTTLYGDAAYEVMRSIDNLRTM